MVIRNLLETTRHFVGRESELKQLHQSWLQVELNNAPCTILITGHGGIGKTMLVEHFLNTLALDTSMITVVKHRCTQLSTGHEPFVNVLLALLNRKTSNDQDKERLLEVLFEFGAIWLDILLMTPGFTQLTLKGAQLVKRAKRRMSAVPENSVQTLYSNLLDQILPDYPTILFLDDFHHADLSTVGMVWHLSKNLAKGKLLLICCYRDDELIKTTVAHEEIREFLGDILSHGNMEIVLDRGISVADYVRTRYQINTFVAEKIEQIQLLTGGIPFYVSELFTYWENHRNIERVGTADGSYGWRFSIEAQSSGSVLIVPKMENLLRHQWDQLAQELRHILSIGAVEGVEFTAQVITRVSQLSESGAIDDLDLLERRYRVIEEAKLDRPRDGVVLDFYRFTHEFHQKFIYDNLNAHNRRRLHLSVGSCLEALCTPNIPNEIMPQLARHFAVGQDWPRAAYFALESAKLAKANYAWSEAESWCQRGLHYLQQTGDFAEKQQKRFSLLETSAYGLYLAGKSSESRERFVAALELLDCIVIEPARLVQLYIYLADACEDNDEYEEGLDYLEIAEAILLQSGDTLNAQKLMLVAQKGLLMARTDNVHSAITLLEQAIRDSSVLESSTEVQESLIGLYNCLGIAMDYIDGYHESIELYGKAAKIARDIDDKHMEVTCLTNQADSLRLLERFSEANSVLSQCIALAATIGDMSAEAYARLVHGETLLDLGHVEKAIQVLRDSLQRLRVLDMKYFVAYALADLAIAHLALSDYRTAEEYASQGLEVSQFDHGPRAYALRAWGKCDAAQSRWELAAKSFRAALSIYENNDDEHYAARLKCDLAETLLHMGLQSEARALLLSARASFERLGLQHQIDKVNQLLDQFR